MVTGAGQGVITYALGLRAGEGGSPSLGPSLELAIGAGEMGCSRQQRRHSPLERQDEKALRPSSGPSGIFGVSCYGDEAVIERGREGEVWRPS